MMTQLYNQERELGLYVAERERAAAETAVQSTLIDCVKKPDGYNENDSKTGYECT